MLRAFALGMGVLALIAGLLLCFNHEPPGVQLLIFGSIWTGGILLERWRYVKRTSAGGTWTLTEERFEEPDTGRVLAVYYNESTGERRYEPSPAPVQKT